jgi:hypothetical protein
MNRFLVTVLYRQPTYEKHACDDVSRLHPYRASYEVVTDDEGRARELAVREFRRTARESGSGWVRLIVGVECEALGDDVVCQVMGEALSET